MKNKVLKTAIIMLVIITLTMANFVQLGTNLITYALENISNSTSNNNVKFAVYFKTEEEKSQIEYEMNSDEMKLYIEVAVEQKGYFDGVITLENSNFKIKQNNTSDAISSIDGNTITLNRVRAGNTAKIELAIEPIIEESYEYSMLSKESILKLTGTYNDGEETTEAIETEKTVRLNLTVPADIETNLEGKVITNRIYKIGEQNKRIIQIELNNTVVENAYPIKKSTFNVQLPNGVEQIEVITKGTYATNGEADRTLSYKQDEQSLNIAIENEVHNGKISWEKNAKDNIIVTLILDAEQEINEEAYSVKSRVEFYGQEAKSLEKEATYNISEEADGIIRASSNCSEVIYKGKLYSKEEREYNITTNLEINYANLIEESTFEESTIYRTETEDKVANVEYKTTTIKKSEIEKVLGTEGILTIQNGSKQEQITSETEADENGNIVITYENGVKNLHVTATKAVSTGVIRLNHTKVIKEETYLKEEIDAIKELVETINVKYIQAEYTFERKINLKNVTSEVALTVIPQTISSEENNEIQITLTLKADNEKYELFKNPNFLLIMPEGVTINSISNVTISATDEELTISKIEPATSKQIMIEIAGEQQKYLTSDINTQISFTANVNIEKLMANKVDTIKMSYTNQGKTYEMQSKSINIVASNARIVTNLKLENYNNLGTILESYSDSNQEVKGELPVENREVIKAPVKYTVINNNDEAMTLNVSIIAKLTDKDENVETLISYLGEITLESGEMKLIEQILQIPAGLYFSEKVELVALVKYTYSGTEYSVPNTINLATEQKEGIRDISIVNDKIQVETFMQLSDENGIKADDEVYNEQIVKYIVEVTNISNEMISNLTITNNQENGNIYDLKEIQVSNIAIQEEPIIEHRYGELETNSKTFEIDNLEPGESRELVYQVVVKKTEENDITSANISISADGIEAHNIDKISNKVKDANLKIASRRALNEEVQIYGDSSYLVLTTIKNLTDKELTNTSIRIHLSEGLTYKENYPIEALDENDQALDIIENIEYNSEGNYIDLKLTSLSANQEITLTSMLYIEKITTEETSKDVTVYLEVNDMVSNAVISHIEQMETEVTVVQNVNIAEGQKIKNKDTVIITAEIVNTGSIDSTIVIEDKVPNGLEINKFTVIKNGERIDETEVVTNNIIMISLDIAKGETITIEIETIVNTSRIVTDTVENTISIKPYAGEEVQANTIILEVESTIDTNTGDVSDYEKPEEPEPEKPQNPDDSDTEVSTPEKPEEQEPVKPENPEQQEPGTTKPEETTYTISGNAWVDKNSNGVKDEGEELKDVIVKLVDLNNQNTFLKDDDGNEIQAETNSNGKYIIENIPEGKYNIIFKYDVGLYELSEKSELKDYIIESTNEKIAITNNVTLESDQVIDLELIELTEFNLKIDKFISKVIVQNKQGTKITEYTKEQLVREEISRKYLAGSNVLVEYTMEVSNIGELAGYVTEIIDYLPTDMKFHSELNTQWYVGEDGNLYNTSLATTVIKPGETQTVTLVLLKAMTKENTGTTANIVEISDTMNIKEYADIDLENNQSKAEIIINVATGTIIAYAIAIINSVVILLIGLYMINKKVIK